MESAKRSSVKQLLRTPSPLPDESLISYIYRLAAANHCASIRWILDLANIKIDSFSFFRSGWKKLCYPYTDFSLFKFCTGLADTQIREMKHEIFCERKYLRGNYHRYWDIPEYAISFTYSKVCPKCLNEAPYSRKSWDLLPLTICPRHKVMLINNCPACSNMITWERKSITECQCGYDWRDNNTRKVKESDLNILKFLMLHPSPIVGDDLGTLQIDNRFMNLSFGDRCRVLLTLADILSYYENGKSNLLSSYFQNNRCHKILMKTIRLLDNWPYELCHFLDRTPPKFNTRYLSQGFDRLEDYSKLEFLRITMDEYLESSSLRSYSPSFSRYIQPNHVYYILKRADINLDVLLASNRVRIVNGLIDPKKVLIDKTSLENMIWQRKNMLADNLASFILGVNDDQLLCMIYHNCLAASSGRHIDGFPSIKLDLEIVMAFYRKIEKLSEPVDSVVLSSTPSENMVSFDDLINLSSSKLSFGKLILAILNKELTPFKLHLSGNEPEFHLLSRFVYKNTEVEKFLANVTEPIFTNIS